MSDAALAQLTMVGYAFGYMLLFLLFGLFWIRLFFPGTFRLKDRRLWPALTVGALALLLTLVAQPPVQAWINSIGNSLGWSVWITGALLVLASGVVQEGLKAIGLSLVRLSASWEVDWKSLGLAVGLGFGLWEAWQLVAWPLATSELWSPIAVLERWSAIGLHLGVTAITAYGFSTSRPLRFTALAALIHGVGNFSVLLYQQWVFNFMATEIYIFVASLFSLLLARYLWKKARSY